MYKIECYVENNNFDKKDNFQSTYAESRIQNTRCLDNGFNSNEIKAIANRVLVTLCGSSIKIKNV